MDEHDSTDDEEQCWLELLEASNKLIKSQFERQSAEAVAKERKTGPSASENLKRLTRKLLMI